MALGERFRSGGARGIARFLGDHQDCDVGFDVRREAGAGTGRLSITCKGCGEGITYKAAEAGELAAGPQVENGGAGLAEPPPAPEEDAFKPVPRNPRRSTDRRLTGLLPLILIGVLIVAGLVLIAVGVLRSDGEADSGGPTAPTPTEESAPAEAASAETPPPQQQAPEVRLNRREFEQRFAIGVPVGWRAGSGDNAIVIAPSGDVAEVRVFLEPGEERPGQLARGAAGFLADEHEGAQIGKPRPLRLGEQRALTVTAVYSGGEESAAVLSWGGYTYLILRRVDSGASPVVAAEANAALDSFRARS